MEDKKRDFRALKEFIAGTGTGVAQVFVAHPFDTIKVRLQASSSQYLGPIDCLKKTVTKEGFTALYKGMTMPMMGITFVNSIFFTTNGYCRRFLGNIGTDPITNKDIYSLQVILIAGGFAGASSAFLLTPIDLVKTKLQIQYANESTSKMYQGPLDCAKKIVQQHGVQGLFRGIWPTTIREGIGNAFWFGGYEFSKQMFTPKDKQINPLLIPMCGSLGGLWYWIAAFPVDTVKTRMQAQQGAGAYAGMIDCVKGMLKEGGPKIFYRGFSTAIARSAPVSATIFSAYEFAMKLLDMVM